MTKKNVNVTVIWEGFRTVWVERSEETTENNCKNNNLIFVKPFRCRKNDEKNKIKYKVSVPHKLMQNKKKTKMPIDLSMT